MMLAKGRFWLVALVVLILGVPTGALAQEERKQDHDQLRALMERGAEALSTRNLDVMAPYVHPDFTVVTIDNKKLKGIAELKAYYDSLFEGKGALLKAIEVRPEADDATDFLDANSGVSFGTSNDRYTFLDGDVREMKSRWSAVVQKDGDTWKLVNVHFSANILDNPVLNAAKSALRNTMLIAGAVGLLVGVAIGFLLRRRRK
jgi:ketosteroid isomerase-like protein